jgi:hypothetical protein
MLHTDPIYRDLPYGIWTCADGRQVLFNRRYQPMWQRMPGEQASEANPDERIPFERQEWLYSDADPPWKSEDSLARCKAILEAWGVQ